MSRRKLIYVGLPVKQDGPAKEVFRPTEHPTQTSHGHLYGAVIGPFKTLRAANFLAAQVGNPHCRSVADAERISKRIAQGHPNG